MSLIKLYNKINMLLGDGEGKGKDCSPQNIRSTQQKQGSKTRSKSKTRVKDVEVVKGVEVVKDVEDVEEEGRQDIGGSNHKYFCSIYIHKYAEN